MLRLVALFAVALLSLGSTVEALAAPNLETCTFSNGRPIDRIECEAMRRYSAAEEEKKARDAEWLRGLNMAAEAERADRDRKRQEDQARWTAERQAREAETAAEVARQEAADRAERAAEARAQAKAVAAKRAACGADYLAPRIGMPIDRALQCVGAFRLQGQINRADGVLSTYLGARRYLHVMDGRVVAWGDL
ncbi:hypothetical protein [Rubrivivax gelatinosus]|uniref:hypothetical protein n=1 Tax=Rubrivivax gelatinosus TaxID=28068 RepID=UPI001907D453|nr:hypothetical protein [Rubrivivax gelatinosus]